MKTTIILVLITSTNSCLLDNISTAQVNRIPMGTMEQCEALAAELDKAKANRAFCEADE